MTLNQTAMLLEERRVPKRFYCIGGLGSGECVGIDQGNGEWQTYYSEHGEKGSVKTFAKESDACADFLQRLQRYLTRSSASTGLKIDLLSDVTVPSRN